MKQVIIGLLMTCVPVCYASGTTTPAQPAQHYKQGTHKQVAQSQQPNVKTVHLQPNQSQIVRTARVAQPTQQQTVKTAQVAQPTQAQGQKRVYVKQTQAQPKTKHITKRRIITRHQQPTVIEEHHVYHTQQQPRRVIVRTLPSNQTVVIRRHHAQPQEYSYRTAPRVTHYRYITEEPRVITRPAPVEMSLGYVVR